MTLGVDASLARQLAFWGHAADIFACVCTEFLNPYEEDPKGIAPRGKYKQLFARNELKLKIITMLRQAPADDVTIAAKIMAAKGWGEQLSMKSVLAPYGGIWTV